MTDPVGRAIQAARAVVHAENGVGTHADHGEAQALSEAIRNLRIALSGVEEALDRERALTVQAERDLRMACGRSVSKDKHLAAFEEDRDKWRVRAERAEALLHRCRPSVFQSRMTGVVGGGLLVRDIDALLSLCTEDARCKCDICGVAPATWADPAATQMCQTCRAEVAERERDAARAELLEQSRVHAEAIRGCNDGAVALVAEGRRQAGERAEKAEARLAEVQSAGEAWGLELDKRGLPGVATGSVTAGSHDYVAATVSLAKALLAAGGRP